MCKLIFGLYARKNASDVVFYYKTMALIYKNAEQAMFIHFYAV